jgi:hypothetical protein
MDHVAYVLVSVGACLNVYNKEFYFIIVRHYRPVAGLWPYLTLYA